MTSASVVYPVRSLIAAALLLLSPLLSAADTLQPYPLAEIESDNRQQQEQHLLATGRIQNKGGEPFPERWLNLPEGTLSQTLYRIRSTRDTDDILQHYRQQLQQAGGEILFQCSSRECGSSTDWANRVFKVSTLYGVDRKQHYLAGRRDENGSTDYLSVYITERGTGRIYAYVSHYQVAKDQVREQGEQGGQVSLFDQLQQQGWVRLPVTADGEFEDDAYGRLQTLSRDLQASDQQFWLVAHHYGKSSDQVLFERSRQAAERLLNALTGLGVAADKIETRALGALAPIKDSVAYGGRIELVIKR